MKCRLGLDSDRTESFYRQFAADIQNSWKISDTVKAMEHADIDSCVLQAESVSVYRKNDGKGSDIYTVYGVSDTPESAGIFSSGGAELHSLLRFFLRLIDNAERFSKYGICTGYPDPDMLAAGGENGGMISFRNLINFSCGDLKSCPYAGITLPFDSGPGDIRDLNLKYACALMWTMLDGRSPGYFPDFTGFPALAPVQVAKAMAGIMSDGAKSLHGLRSAVNTALAGSDDRYISFVSETGTISYRPEFHPGDVLIRMRAAKEEAEDDEYYGKKRKKSPRSLRVWIGAAVCTAVIAGVLLIKAPASVGSSATPVQRMSCEDGIYGFEGRAVGADGILLTDCVIGPDGALRTVTDGALLYDRDHVSAYVAVNEIRYEILLRDFSGGTSHVSYTVEVRTYPEDALERRLSVSSGIPVSVNGDSPGTSHKIDLDKCGRALFTLSSAHDGKCSLTVRPLSGACSVSAELDFSVPPPDLPEEVPVASPAVQSPEPETPFPEMLPAADPVYTPAADPDVPAPEQAGFSLNTYSVTLAPGDTASIVTSGEDGGIIYAYSTDSSVASVEVAGSADGCYTVNALKTGKCEVVFSASGTVRKLEVTVD